MPKHISIYIIVLLIFVGINSVAFAVESNTEYGFIGAEQSVYHVEKHKVVHAKIYGESFQSNRQDITITITLPDSTVKNILISSTDDGKFQTSYILDHTSQTGTYYVSGTTAEKRLGQMTFQVLKRTNDPIVPKPLLTTIPVTSLTMSTDKQLYTQGSLIHIFGMVKTTDPSLYKDTPIVLQIFHLTDLVWVDQINVDDDGNFSTSANTNGTIWSKNGLYTVKAHFAEHDIETTFTVSPPLKSLTQLIPPSTPPSTLQSITQQIHKRANIEVILFGTPFDFTSSVYQMKNDRVRFENNDGVTIHVYDKQANIQDLFTSLGMKITDSCIEFRNKTMFCDNTKTHLLFQVNGVKVDRIYDHIPKDGDNIAITVASIVSPPQLNSLPNTSVTSVKNTPVSSNISPQVVSPSPAPASSSLTSIIILLFVLAVIIGTVIAIKRFSRSKLGKKKTRPAVKKTPRRTQTTGEASTMFYYECPKCHAPDINNNSDGSVLCTKCGFKG